MERTAILSAFCTRWWSAAVYGRED